MFDALGDLPLHPLAIHAVVVAVPLTLLLALTFAIPRFRRWARWPLPVVAVGALGATLIARESGEALQTALKIPAQGGPVAPLIARHSALADQLTWLVAGTAVLAVLAAILVGRTRPGGRGGGARTGAGRGLSLALPLAVILIAALASFWAYRVGDVGSRAVWNPTGTQNYQVGG